MKVFAKACLLLCLLASPASAQFGVEITGEGKDMGTWDKITLTLTPHGATFPGYLQCDELGLPGMGTIFIDIIPFTLDESIDITIRFGVDPDDDPDPDDHDYWLETPYKNGGIYTFRYKSGWYESPHAPIECVDDH